MQVGVRGGEKVSPTRSFVGMVEIARAAHESFAESSLEIFESSDK